ncbi:ATP-binding cassette domain-containing protein [Magnetococcales bacterium HHB-1]
MSTERHFFIPEVIQGSMMDCGPAALKALLGGFGLHVSYGRLREACQTDVDGTSIDTIEHLATQLGIDAVQMLVPMDHVLLPEADALPALIIVRQPNGHPHFIILWRLIAGWVQIMDPATGRHWVRYHTLMERFYQHQQSIPESSWLAWAQSDAFIDILRERMLAICNDPTWADACLNQCLHNNQWYALASLDAATRMITTLVRARGVRMGIEAGELLNQLLLMPEHIPKNYWSVQVDPKQRSHLLFSGAVIIHCPGLIHHEEADSSLDHFAEEEEIESSTQRMPELIAALKEKIVKPEIHIWQALCEDGLLTPLLVIIGTLLAGIGITIEVLVLRALMEVGQQLHLISQQMQAYSLVLLFLLSLLIMEWPLNWLSLHLGQRLEMRLRMRFLKKLPRLEDRYFHSRLTSDMIQRAYDLRELSILPNLAINLCRLLVQIIFITIGLMILYPEGAGRVFISCLIMLTFIFLSQPWLQEKDMRLRTHIGGLSRFYLDALLGLIPIRSHRAEPALRIEHEKLLLHWAKAGEKFFTTFEHVIWISLLINTSISIWLVTSYLKTGLNFGGTLIFLYWLLLLPQLGNQLAQGIQQYPMLRNRLLRLLEPLSAPDESETWYAENTPPPSTVRPLTDIDVKKQGVTIDFHQVKLDLSGCRVLNPLNFHLAPGEHVAIVGRSGAGKSSLVGLLLGWYRPAIGGSIWIDGQLLQGETLQRLRQTLVWVDPKVQLWNRSLLDNLNYGQKKTKKLMPEVLEQAELLEVITHLPDGIDTVLGENAGRLSGGEGQRVRLGRGFNQGEVRLVILDEPFRGLTRRQRTRLLKRARRLWCDATLIFISHDVADTQSFDRVWVVHDKEIVEDASPQALLSQPNSHYQQLLKSEQRVRSLIWNSTAWQKWRMKKGRVVVQTKKELKKALKKERKRGIKPFKMIK